MRRIPITDDTPVLRTDFSDNLLWKSVCDEIQKPVGEFKAYVNFIDDPQYENLNLEKIHSLISPDSNHTTIFIIDSTTIKNPEHPVLVVDLDEQLGQPFRVIPSEMWSVENNLSIANMGFDEFAESVDKDGIFRGFSKDS